MFPTEVWKVDGCPYSQAAQSATARGGGEGILAFYQGAADKKTAGLAV